MSEMTSTNRTLQLIAIIAEALEELDNALLRTRGMDEELQGIRHFSYQVKNGNMTCVYLDWTEAEKMKDKLEEKAVPFLYYKGQYGARNMIFVPSEYTDYVTQLDKDIRIYAGLEIDDKGELDRAIYEMEGPTNRNEYVISGLTGYEASRIVQMATDARPKFAAVSEQQPDGTWIVASHPSRAMVMNVYATIAMLEDGNTSPIMENAKKSQFFFDQQKENFRGTVDNMRLGKAEETYLFSTAEPGKYMHISQYGYEIVENGTVINRDSMSGRINGGIEWSSESYADRAWLFGSSIKDYVFVRGDEVAGDPEGFVKNSLPQYPKRVIPNMVKGEAVFTRVVRDMIDAKNAPFFISPESYRLDTKTLIDKYRQEIENSSMSPDDKEKALANIPHFEESLNGFVKQINESVRAGIEDVKVSGDQIISDAYMQSGAKDPSMDDLFYDRNIVSDILNEQPKTASAARSNAQEEPVNTIGR